MREFLAAEHQKLADVALDVGARDVAVAVDVHVLPVVGRELVAALVRAEHAPHHGLEVRLGLVAEVAERLLGGELVGPELREPGHVVVQAHAEPEARMVASNLGEELVRREGQAGQAVAALRLLQQLLVGLLQRDEPARQVVREDERQADVGGHGADVRVAHGQPEARRLVRRREQRVERVLRRPVAPDGLRVEHARQHREARIAAVVFPERVEELAAAPLLQSVVGPRVLRRVVAKPARRDARARRRRAEGPDRVREADAPRADGRHRVEDVLHAADRHRLRDLGVHGRLDGQGRREVPDRRVRVRVVLHDVQYGVGVRHVDRAHRRALGPERVDERPRQLFHAVRRDDAVARLRQRRA
mmetsp:Transcript_2880/g.8711  ORF Transcript_2880/g.8711 Transcript_2880/m.8711 type:complete len:360 (+) Transcript_2880:200-1279(+)